MYGFEEDPVRVDEFGDPAHAESVCRCYFSLIFREVSCDIRSGAGGVGRNDIFGTVLIFDDEYFVCRDGVNRAVEIFPFFVFDLRFSYFQDLGLNFIRVFL